MRLDGAAGMDHCRSLDRRFCISTLHTTLIVCCRAAFPPLPIALLHNIGNDLQDIFIPFLHSPRRVRCSLIQSAMDAVRVACLYHVIWSLLKCNRRPSMTSFSILNMPITWPSSKQPAMVLSMGPKSDSLTPLCKSYTFGYTLARDDLLLTALL